jgi:prepilin signal peptidase PulO-like enzyme (type II secretory pathway)
MIAMAAILTALLFSAAAWAGTLLAEMLCADRTPAEDGPAPIPYKRWPFAAGAAAIGIVVGFQGISPAHAAIFTIAVLALAGCAAADLSCGMLPDVLTLGPLAIFIAAAVVLRSWSPVLGAAVAFVPFAATALVSRGRGMGWGDAKLAAFGGAFLGARDATLAFTLAAIAAYIVARRSGHPKRAIAFGPYLAGSIATISLTTGAH